MQIAREHPVETRPTPQSLRQGYVPAPGTEATDAIIHYWQAVLQDVLELGREVLDGREDVEFRPPDGFRVVRQEAS